ncbi:MAG TPA: sulfate ABC transporter substrate-binding protein, partial [Steroidobacteraceae bacterium]
YALDRNGGDQAKARAFVARLLANVPVFDTGGRGATTTFVERQIGDALITFESEVQTIRGEEAGKGLALVVPSVSLRADFPVAVVEKVAARHGTQALATAYLKFLFSEPGQEILARGHNRVDNPAVLARHPGEFPAVKLVSVQQAFGGWDEVTKNHFADGGILDQALATIH